MSVGGRLSRQGKPFLVVLLLLLVSSCGAGQRPATSTVTISAGAAAAASPTITISAGATATPTVARNPEIPAPPTATALAGATATVQANAASLPVAPSGGLGNTRADLDRRYGPPDTIEEIQLTYQKGQVQVRVQGDPTQASSRAVNMDRFTEPPFGSPLSLGAAEALAKPLLPTDAVFVRRYDLNDHQSVVVYTSAQLAAVIDRFFFTGASGASVPPGTFDVIYTQNATGQIIKLTLAAGDNP